MQPLPERKLIHLQDTGRCNVCRVCALPRRSGRYREGLLLSAMDFQIPNTRGLEAGHAISSDGPRLFVCIRLVLQ